MTAETEKQQRTRLAAGMLATYAKRRDGEVTRIPCMEVDVQKLVRRMPDVERAELTAEVNWLCDYEAGEAFQGD